jgi:hypothetical protein
VARATSPAIFLVTAEGGLRTDTGRFATSCSCSLGDRPISGNGLSFRLRYPSFGGQVARPGDACSPTRTNCLRLLPRHDEVDTRRP